MITSDLTWQTHVDYTIKRVNGKIWQLVRFSQQGASKEKLIQFYVLKIRQLWLLDYFNVGHWNPVFALSHCIGVLLSFHWCFRHIWNWVNCSVSNSNRNWYMAEGPPLRRFKELKGSRGGSKIFSPNRPTGWFFGPFLDASGKHISATIRIGREIGCLLYGFFFIHSILEKVMIIETLFI